jgi:hypothetical protein
VSQQSDKHRCCSCTCCTPCFCIAPPPPPSLICLNAPRGRPCRRLALLQEYESRLRRAAAAGAPGLEGGLAPADAALAAAAGGLGADLEMQQVPLAEVALGRAPSVSPVPPTSAAAAAAGLMMPSVASGGSAGSGVGLLRAGTLPAARPLGADRVAAGPHMLRTSSTAWGLGEWVGGWVGEWVGGWVGA